MSYLIDDPVPPLNLGDGDACEGPELMAEDPILHEIGELRILLGEFAPLPGADLTDEERAQIRDAIEVKITEWKSNQDNGLMNTILMQSNISNADERIQLWKDAFQAEHDYIKQNADTVEKIHSGIDFQYRPEQAPVYGR